MNADSDKPAPSSPAAEHTESAAPAAPETSERKSSAELLREAMAAKNAQNRGGKGKLRADFSNAKSQRDAERRAGKSRKVH